MKTLKNISVVAFIVLLMVTSAAVGQFTQSMYSLTDVRNEKMALWANNDDKRVLAVSDFTKKCLIGGSVKNDKEISAPISVYGCAENNGFSELGNVIKDADTILQSYAWPISMIAN